MAPLKGTASQINETNEANEAISTKIGNNTVTRGGNCPDKYQHLTFLAGIVVKPLLCIHKVVGLTPDYEVYFKSTSPPFPFIDLWAVMKLPEQSGQHFIYGTIAH